MGVEEERRKARVAEEIAVHAGMGAVALEQRDVFEATALEQLGDGERAAPNVGRWERCRRDAGDAHERAQIRKVFAGVARLMRERIRGVVHVAVFSS